MTTMTYSRYQEAIFSHVTRGENHLVVKAVAGAGKTTTLTEICKRLKGRSKLFCAFNKHIAEELGKRLKGVEVRTIHSLGMRCLGKVNINGKKYWGLVREWTKDNHIYGKKAEQIIPWLKEVVALGQANLVSGEGIMPVIASLGQGNLLGNRHRVIEAYEVICRRGIEQYEENGEIDFGDMIWLPNRLGLLGKLRQYGAVLVDELQDLNRAQQEIVIGSLAAGGIVVGVGDPAQSIYGFAGADPLSMERMIERLGADVLPLSACYRCPRSHIKLAKEFNPVIETGKTEEGEIYHWSPDQYMTQAQSGDLVICRRTAPLVEMALKLLSNKVACRIRGRDIGQGIKRLITETAPTAWSIKGHLENIDRWFIQELGTLDPLEDKQAIGELKDRAMCLNALIANSGAKSLGELLTLLERLFSDDEGENTIWLSTVHRAKGLESDRVILLNRSRMPDEMASTPTELEQENNLLYVAHTRAKKVLIFVEDK